MPFRPSRAVWRQPLNSLRAASQSAPRTHRAFATISNRQTLTSTLRRPTLSQTTNPLVFHTQQTRDIFIQTEETPNTDALKFKPSQTRILPSSSTPTPPGDPLESRGPKIPFLEYLTPRSTLQPPYPSPLAAELLAIDGVNAVFYGADYITVTKDSGSQWPHVKPEVFALITQYVASGTPIVTFSESRSGHVSDGVSPGDQGQEKDSLAYDEDDDEVVGMIKELLETRIRPAIQEDGGDIDFRGFVDGQVLLKLRGACRTCDSSTVTLKNGIESMLCHYIEEVKGVQQVLDPEEEVAMREFAKFEEKLKQNKGAGAVAGSPSLDSAP